MSDRLVRISAADRALLEHAKTAVNRGDIYVTTPPLTAQEGLATRSALDAITDQWDDAPALCSCSSAECATRSDAHTKEGPCPNPDNLVGDGLCRPCAEFKASSHV